MGNLWAPCGIDGTTEKRGNAMDDRDEQYPEVRRSITRRRFVQGAVAGSVIAAAGGVYMLARDPVTEKARAERLPDGRPRLPPGQRVIEALRDMGGNPGNPSPSAYRLRVYGEV